MLIDEVAKLTMVEKQLSNGLEVVLLELEII